MGLANGPFLAAGEYAKRENIREGENHQSSAEQEKEQEKEFRHEAQQKFMHVSSFYISN